MKTIFTRIAALLAFLFSTNVAFSQVQQLPPEIQLQLQRGLTPGVQADAPLAVSAGFEPAVGRVGRPVEYRVTILGSQRLVQLPELEAPPGLDVMPPRIAGGIGRQISRYAVVAHRAGEFTMPGFEVQVAGKLVKVPPATLIVQEPQPGEAVYHPVKAVLDLPQRDLFVGETIVARLLLIETEDESPQFISHVAKTNGAVVFRPDMRTRREQFPWAGKPASGLVMPVQITPITEGESEVNCQIVVQIARNEDGGIARGTTMQSTLDTPNAHIRVLALPRAEQRAGFTGGIGNFTLSQPKLSAAEVEAGEPITLTVALSGEGNLEGVAAPEIGEVAGWQGFKPTTDFQRDESEPSIARGTKTFTYTLIPRRAGLKGTPPLPFSFFDPVKRAYVDATVPPLPVVVKASTAPAAAAPSESRAEAAAQNDTPREVPLAMTGLAEHSGRWSQRLGPVLWQRWFLAAQLVPPLALLLLWAWRRRREYLAAHPEIARRRLARAAAKRALSTARSAARKGDSKGFLDAGIGALREAAAPHDSAKAASLTREEVLLVLRDDAEAARAARSVFEAADAARYTTATAAPEPRKLLPELERAVRRLTSLALWMLLSLSLPLAAQTPDARFAKATAAYAGGDFAEAAYQLRPLVDEGHISAGALHNLGNAEWKVSRPGYAILAWERAVALDPANLNTAANLRFARHEAKLGAPVLGWHEQYSAWLPSAIWLAAAMLGLWGGVSLLVLPRLLGWRRADWHQGVAALLLAIFLLSVPAIYGLTQRAQIGVVLEEETPLRLMPTREGETLVKVAAGEVARVEKVRGDYLYVRAEGDRAGWLRRTDFARIWP